MHAETDHSKEEDREVQIGNRIIHLSADASNIDEIEKLAQELVDMHSKKD